MTEEAEAHKARDARDTAVAEAEVADICRDLIRIDTTNPGDHSGPGERAAAEYVAGLLACGTCGRRLESAWSNGKPAYRCRHGYTSAVGSTPGRPANLYIREDQILPRLAALAILHADGSHSLRSGEDISAQVTAPAQAADLIDRLRAADVTLIYDPAARTLRNGTRNSLAVTVG